jgi:hypothetical protein
MGTYEQPLFRTLYALLPGEGGDAALAKPVNARVIVRAERNQLADADLQEINRR